MSDDYGVDLEEVFKVIDAADVLVVRFHIVRKRLLVDFRTKSGTNALVAIVEPASSIEERFRAIKELRPGFPAPERVMSFHWPRMMRVFESSGVWGRIRERATSLGTSPSECDGAWQTLCREERGEVAAAIRGADHYQTLWESSRA